MGQLNVGWKCPGCSRIYNPAVVMCLCQATSTLIVSKCEHEWITDGKSQRCVKCGIAVLPGGTVMSRGSVAWNWES